MAMLNNQMVIALHSKSPPFRGTRGSRRRRQRRSAACRGFAGAEVSTDGMPCENDGKIMGKSWENLHEWCESHYKSWEKHYKSLEKNGIVEIGKETWEHVHKSREHHYKSLGNPNKWWEMAPLWECKNQQ